MPRRQLVIIPGLGDRGGLYRLIVPLWSLFGYQVHIFIFGWEQRGLDFTAALTRLTAYIDGLATGQVCIIGVSAGGTAAINALAERPTTIAKVVTVCTPYSVISSRKNALMRTSIQRAGSAVVRMNNKAKRKILSVYGLYDEVVPVIKSKPEGIAQKRLWSVGHGLSICLALTAYSNVINRFLKEDQKSMPVHRVL